MCADSDRVACFMCANPREEIMPGMGMIWGSEGYEAILRCARESYGLRNPESNTRKDEFSLSEMTSQSEVSQEERYMSFPSMTAARQTFIVGFRRESCSQVEIKHQDAGDGFEPHGG